MNNYNDWYEYSLDDLRKECSQRGVSYPISKWDAIQKLVASDRNIMEQQKDRRAYDNLTDPLGEKRFAQAQAERDWNLHETKCMGNIVIEASFNLARSRSPVQEFFEAEAREKEAVLQARLTSICDSFKAKTENIMREARQLTEEQLRCSMATEDMLVDHTSSQTIKTGEACGSEESTSVGDSQQQTRNELSICLNKGEPTTSENVASINASVVPSGEKGPITPPLQRPFIFLHRKYLQSGDEQLENLRRDIETKLKKFNEEQGLDETSFARPPAIKCHTSGFYIGYRRGVDVENLHQVLKRQPLFGKEVHFRLVLDSTPKDTSANPYASLKRPAGLDYSQSAAKKIKDDTAEDVKFEVVDYDPRPMLRGTPWLFLTPKDRTSFVTLEQVTMAYNKMSTASESVIWAKGYHMGIFVHFENSTRGRVESARLEDTEVLDGFYRICNYR